MTFSGWAGAPGLNRSTRDAQYLFVNGRPIRDRLFVHAAYAAYRSFLPVKRHPVFILFLDMPPGRRGCERSPSHRQEVRFRFASGVYDIVRESVAAVLGARPQKVRRDFADQGAGQTTGSVAGLATEEPTVTEVLPTPRASTPALLGGGGYFGDQEYAPPGNYDASGEEESTGYSQPVSGAQGNEPSCASF